MKFKNGIAVYVILLLFFCTCSFQHNAPTWTDGISELIYTNCSPCHRDNGNAPFALLTYEQVKAKANRIRWATETRYMPPWPADPTYRHFLYERVLSAAQIKMLSLWISLGMPKGDSMVNPKPPDFYKGSFFRKPDLVIHLQRAVKLSGNGRDSFIIAKFPYRLPKDTLLDFVEFVPGLKRRVHHVNGHLLSYTRNASNPFQGLETYGDTKVRLDSVYTAMGLKYTDTQKPDFPVLTPNTVYYLPGYLPLAYPKPWGGIKLKKTGVFLLNNIHYGPSLYNQYDSSVLNVFFRSSPIERPFSEAQIGSFGLAPVTPDLILPANQKSKFTSALKLEKKISLLSVNPHMHQTGATFKAYALKPNGDTIPIIRILKWDFRWQYYYTFEYPVILDAGTWIKLEATFDNTAQNPNNPFRPPRTITSGNGIESMKSSEEMLQLIFTYAPYRKGDELQSLKRTF
jgi:hypothetical protein